MSDTICQHNSLARVCEICERDAEIARLLSDNATLRTAFADNESENARLVKVVEWLESEIDHYKAHIERGEALVSDPRRTEYAGHDEWVYDVLDHLRGEKQP